MVAVENRDNSVIWTPSAARSSESKMSAFMHHINKSFELNLSDYEDLHAWSVANLESFWSASWDFLGVVGDKGTSPFAVDLCDMVNATFFPAGSLNLAENCLTRRDDGPAVVFSQENVEKRAMSWKELYAAVSGLTAQLRADGVTKGDRVCAVAANVPETVICMLATASIGAIWSSVSPDFGVEGILERFRQIEPKVFFHSDWYKNKNRVYDVSERMKEVESKLSPLISVSLTDGGLQRYCVVPAPETIVFERTSFNDPVFIMFSSGTTGKPKCIVHRHGVLLQLMKEHQLHSDIRRDDCVIYYTTTTWMMWNWLVTVLASDATVMLFEGNPFFPSCNVLFEFAADHKCSFFGVSAKFIDALKSSPEFVSPPVGIESVNTIASTGSPLIPESFDFVYAKIKKDVNLASICGGTDIVSCFMLGCPTKPVKRGFAQCRGLGLDVQVWDPETRSPVTNAKGELVCCQPFPAQPLKFWGDSDRKDKYREAYFGEFANVWKHGDFCLLDSQGHVFVYGRSDATLKPGGVRIGTAEIYRAVESLPFVKEAICCGLELTPGDEVVALFVSLIDPSATLTHEHRAAIRKAIAASATRHHVPKLIEQVDDIPRTKSGKIVELAVKNVLHNLPVKNLNALANPEALNQFAQFAIARIPV